MLQRRLLSQSARAGMTTWPTITLAVDEDNFATLTLNRAQAHNAFDSEMIQNLSHCLDQELIEANTGRARIRGLFIAASGKTFCAGGDLKSMKRLGSKTNNDGEEDANKRDAVALSTFLLKLNRAPFPTIALVQGNAFGGGVGLASVCDIAVGVSSAMFGLTEVKLGLIPATISPYVAARIGASQCRRYFLTAERFDSNTAKKIGLLHEVCDTLQELDEWKNRFKQQLLGNAPGAVAAAKDLIFFLDENSTDPVLLVEETANRLAKQRETSEAQHGIQAFLEKRAPVWNKS